MRVLALTFMLLFGASCAPAMAQSGLDESQKAVIVFDIRMDKIRSSDLAKALDLDEKMNAIRQPNSPNPGNLERVFGAMSAPENMAAAQSIQGGKMPMEFFVRIKFNDSAEVDKMISKADEDNGGVIEKNGKKYYKAPEQGGMPAGVMLYAVDSVTLEMGTEAYIFRKDAKPFTDGLNKAWANVPADDAVRIAIDLVGAKGLIGEAVASAQQAGDPMVSEYLNLIDNMKNLRVSMDVSGKNLLTIQTTGVSVSEAEELRGGIDSLLGMAQMGGQALLGQIRQVDPEGAVVVGEILKALVTSGEGADISIVIPKPEGFDAAVKKAVEMIPQMMGGGLGGPGGPPPGSGGR